MFRAKTGMIFVLSFLLYFILFLSLFKMTLACTCTRLSCIDSISRLHEEKKLNGTKMCRVCFSVKTRADGKRGAAELEKVHRKALCEVRPVSRAQEPIQPRRSRSVHEDIMTSSHLHKQPRQTDRKEQTSNPLNQIHKWRLLPWGPTVMSAQPLPVCLIHIWYM